MRAGDRDRIPRARPCLADAPVEICTMQAVPAEGIPDRCPSRVDDGRKRRWHACKGTLALDEPVLVKPYRAHARTLPRAAGDRPVVSEEHTSELQSPCNLVCRL